jgi:uncharacterized membrane protein
MGKGRLEAFSDGVIAILLTVMVLELKVPQEPGMAALLTTWPTLFSYVLSFLYLGIYWNNHHHLLHLCRKVTGGVLWANLHLLFWLSLVPFATNWLGANHFAKAPAAIYGLVLFLSALAYWILQNAIICAEGEDSPLGKAMGRDFKGKISLLLYLAAIGLSFLSEWLAMGIYVLVALIWVVPDRRIERQLSH